MKRKREEWEPEVAKAVTANQWEHAINTLNQSFVFAGVEDQFDILEMKCRILDNQFVAVSEEAKSKVLEEKMTVLVQKLALLDKKLVTSSGEAKSKVLEEKMTVLDQKLVLVGSGEAQMTLLEEKLSVLRKMPPSDGAQNTKIETIAKLIPFSTPEVQEALQAESARTTALLGKSSEGMVSVFVLSTELELRVQTDPCLFRSVLWRRIQQDKLVVYGTCDRNAGKISIRFMVIDLPTRTRLAEMIQDVAKQCESAVRADVDFPMFTTIVTETVDVAKLAIGWKYERQKGSPAPKLFVHHTSPAAETVDVQFDKGTRRQARARSDGSSSSGQQIAHILFKSQAYDTPMLQILASLEQADYNSAQQELDKMQKLAYLLDYPTHQDYDNFKFFYAWRFSEQPDGSWALVTQPRFMDALVGEDLQVVQVSSLSPEDHLKWRHALALRKALTIANKYGQVEKATFRKDWESDVSACWME